MHYVVHTNMSPFLGRSFADDPAALVGALDSIAANVVSGYARAGARKAEVLVAADNHRQLMLMTVPWCIVTGEHPEVEPVLRGVHKGQYALFGSVLSPDVDRPSEAIRGPRFLISLDGGLLVGQDAKVEQIHEIQKGLRQLQAAVVDSYYELNSGKLQVVVATEAPETLAGALSVLREATAKAVTVEPVMEWPDFLDGLRQIGRLSKAPATAPEGCCGSPGCLEEVRPLTMPAGGTDRLHFTTWDTIEIPGAGERQIRLDGHYQIERQHPSCADWAKAEVEIEMKEMDVRGTDELLGDVRAFLRSDAAQRSWGRVESGTLTDNRHDAAKACRMNANVGFEIGKLGMTVVSKAPIPLSHSITHIPPIGQGGGTGDVRIPLYDARNLEGEPVAYLRRVVTHIGDFVEPRRQPAPGHQH